METEEKKGLKKKVAIIFGGRSPEHNISLLSAQNVFKSLDRSRYEPVLIGIDKNGQWHYNATSLSLLNDHDPNSIEMADTSQPILLSQNTNEHTVISASRNEKLTDIDVLFPILHGNYGEDGSVQGFAKLANIPCVGCGIVGSAIGMDKDIMKRVLRDANINVAPGVTIRNKKENADYPQIVRDFGHELFIKPANLGSSVGVSFVDNAADFDIAIESALRYDTKVLVEKKIIGREIECAILGNHDPQASVPGEIVPKSDFYSFENKYIDEDGAALKIPADLTPAQIERIQELVIRTFTVLECRGMARVDMFLCPDDTIIINEINTIPGFTNISMYPKLWEHSGLPQEDLITKLIELAIEEHQIQNNLLDS